MNLGELVRLNLASRSWRTPLGDVVTTTKDDAGDEYITLECPLELQERQEFEPYGRSRPSYLERRL